MRTWRPCSANPPRSSDISARRKAYRRPLPEVLEAVRQDGLIQIRRASFEQLKKSATVITQQYNRFLPPVKQDDDGARAAIEALTAAVTLPEEEVREVFS